MHLTRQHPARRAPPWATQRRKRLPAATESAINRSLPRKHTSSTQPSCPAQAHVRRVAAPSSVGSCRPRDLPARRNRPALCAATVPGAGMLEHASNGLKNPTAWQPFPSKNVVYLNPWLAKQAQPPLCHKPSDASANCIDLLTPPICLSRH